MNSRLPRDDDARSDIIGGLYDVALDPARYEELLDLWERRVGTLRAKRTDTGQLFTDREIEAHCERAGLFLDRDQPSDDPRDALLAEFRTAAAFVVDPSLQVSRVNSVAETWLGVRPGMAVSGLPFDAEALEHLAFGMGRTFAGRGPHTLQMRIRSPRSDGVTLLQVRLLPGPDPFALVVTSEFEWPEALDTILSDAFGLSPSETLVIRGLVEASTLKEIALQRGRSVETIRTQLKAIFQKTQTHGQTELIRVCLSLMDIVAVTEAAMDRVPTSSRGCARLAPRPFRRLTLPDGRHFDYLILGDPSGQPLLFLPLDYGFVRWPAGAEAAAARRGWRIIVPVRAGFGASTPISRDIAPEAYGSKLGADVHHLLDHLDVACCPILGMGSDSWYAHHIAALRPKRITGILMAAGALPMTRAAQYERMGKWHRFINANALYAPKVFPFMVKAGFSLARRIGQRNFLHAVYAGSPADLAIVEDPEVLEAILSGTEVALSKAHSAHRAFAREIIAQTLDWSPMVRACRAIPTRFLMGDQDEHAPPATVGEWEADWPHIRFERIEGAGYLLFFRHWPTLLDRLEEMMADPAA
ncbi:LuxR C-terminal-related transcriptional regulator [Thalassococcus sp. S3]|uniref:LuxR C-terminal-related transcriptional regulator n=1 Tax=Thalassococcus sp. S3 TaxID=2017482 RepID=UPI00102492D4|nr:LuxR C-terminal-related transcriptional regulator [Thalassococcus sp. S3]QBF30488.1 helix-turn-helix transcriptional regulator [Thalassococcus sp. S3]